MHDPKFSRFDTILESAKHTDRHTTMAYTALSIASRGKNCRWWRNEVSPTLLQTETNPNLDLQTLQAMVMNHTHAKGQGQLSVGSKGKWKQTDLRMDKQSRFHSLLC